MYDTGVLSRGNVGRTREPAGEQILMRLQFRFLDPCGDGRPGRIRQFKLHWPLSLSLQNHCPG